MCPAGIANQLTPMLTVVHDQYGVPKHLMYDDKKGHVIDLTEIMWISKVGWGYNHRDGLSQMTITFDCLVASEFPEHSEATG